MVFNISIGLVMVVSFIGMIICAKKQHLNAMAKPAAVGLLVVVVICAIMMMSHNMGDGSDAGVIEKEMQYYKASTYVLGKKVAEMNPGSRVLLIVDKINEKNQRQQAMIEGFKEGCSSSISDIKVVAPQIDKASGADMLGTGLDTIQLTTAKTFNKLLSKNKGYKIIFSTIGLPYDAGNLKIFKDFDKSPKTCAKLVMLGGNTLKLAPLIQAGLVKALVVHKPDADFTKESVSQKMEDLFHDRYILITKKNLEEIKKKYPGRIFLKK